MTVELNHLSYVEWKKINPIVAEKCDYCNGSGICDCELCGHETECLECSGAGSIELSGWTYDKQLKLDKKNAERWYLMAAEAE